MPTGTEGGVDVLHRLRVSASANTDIILITAAGFFLRVGWLIVARPMPISDWHLFKQLAFALQDHGQLGYPDPSTFYLPGLPVFLALWAVLSRSDVWLGLGTIMLSTATIPILFAAGLHILHERRPALIAAGLFAALPVFVFFSPVLATEHLFVLLVVTAILLVVSRDGDIGMTRSVVVGIVLALAMLTRGEAVFYIPAFLFFIWFGSKVATRRGALQASLVFLAAIALTLAPWYVRNSFVGETDTGLSTGAGVNFYFAHNNTGIYGWYPEGQPFEGMSDEEASDLAWSLAFDYLGENPLRLFRNVPFGTKTLFSYPDYALFWSTHYVPGEGDRNDPALFVQREVPARRGLEVALWLSNAALIVAAGLSILVARRWTRELWTLVMPLIGSIWVLRTIIYWAKPRYRYTADVLLLFFAALVIWIVIRKRAGRDETEEALT